MRGLLSVLVLVVWMALLPNARRRPGRDCRHGERHVRRRASRRQRRSRQSRADREGPHRGHRRHRPVPDRGSAARAPTPSRSRCRASARSKREGIELTGSFTATINADLKVGSARGNDHRHRREPDRRRPEREARDVRDATTSSRPIPTVRSYNAIVVRRAGRRHQHQRRRRPERRRRSSRSTAAATTKAA